MIGYTRDSMGLDRDTRVSHHGVPGHRGLFGRGVQYRCDYNRLPRLSI
jgi:hypothetical protein